MQRRILLCAALAGLAGIPALAEPPPVAIENAWARATPGSGRTGAVYFTITGHGPPDRLVGVASPVAAIVGLHETVRDGDVMRMRPIDGLAIAPGTPVVFAPGGYHVMLEQLQAPLTVGQKFPLTLRFKNAGTIETTVVVRPAGSSGAAMPMDHAGMDKP